MSDLYIWTSDLGCGRPDCRPESPAQKRSFTILERCELRMNELRNIPTKTIIPLIIRFGGFCIDNYIHVFICVSTKCDNPLIHQNSVLQSTRKKNGGGKSMGEKESNYEWEKTPDSEKIKTKLEGGSKC